MTRPTFKPRQAHEDGDLLGAKVQTVQHKFIDQLKRRIGNDIRRQKILLEKKVSAWYPKSPVNQIGGNYMARKNLGNRAITRSPQARG